MTRSARVLAGALVLALAVVACNSQPALLRQARKRELVDDIRTSLLESANAENGAVLAVTDEESVKLAHEAQGLSEQVTRQRNELQTLVVEDGRAPEVKALGGFDTAWTDLAGVDRRLLDLAVANTNLKAARLSATEGATTLDHFVDALTALQVGASEPGSIRALSSAAVAALREQSVLLVHIPSGDDAEMTRLEQRMSALTAEVNSALTTVRNDAGVPAPQLAAATASWQDYQRIAAEIVRLSRENSNVRSFDVSVHEKRKATQTCLAALDQLEAAIQSSPQAAR